MADENPQADLIIEAEVFATKAANNSSGDRYIAGAAPKLIASNGRVEAALTKLTDVTEKNARATDRYTRWLIYLTVVLVVLTLVLVFRGG